MFVFRIFLKYQLLIYQWIKLCTLICFMLPASKCKKTHVQWVYSISQQIHTNLAEKINLFLTLWVWLPNDNIYLQTCLELFNSVLSQNWGALTWRRLCFYYGNIYKINTMAVFIMFTHPPTHSSTTSSLLHNRGFQPWFSGLTVVHILVGSLLHHIRCE